MSTNTQHNPDGMGTRQEAEVRLLECWRRYCETRQPTIASTGRSESARRRALAHEARNRLAEAGAMLAWHIDQGTTDADSRTISGPSIPEAAIESAFRAYLASTGRASAIPAALMREMLAAAVPHMAPKPTGAWAIDTSAGTPILVYEKCSVIEDDQARYVLGLIAADMAPKPSPSADSVARDAERYRKVRDECTWTLTNSGLAVKLIVNLPFAHLFNPARESHELDAVIDDAGTANAR